MHFSDDIDLHNIADEAYFSKFHFIRLFKTIYGKTPHQYLTRVRIENAIVFLQKEIPVTETYFAVGFDSVSSFTALFKRYTNLSPSAYQRQFRKRRQQIEKFHCNSFQIVLLNKKAGHKKAIFKKWIEKTLLTLFVKQKINNDYKIKSRQHLCSQSGQCL